MQATARYFVDWDGDLFICKETLVTDALNVMHDGLVTDPGVVNLHWNYLNTAVINSSTVSISQLLTDYGIRIFQVVTGTNTTAGGHFGYDGSGAADILVANGAAYTAVMWIKATVGSGTSLKLEMVNATASVTFSVSGSWQKVTLNFTPTSTTTGFKITKNTSATNVTFQATGFMVVSGSSAPNGFNVGNVSNRYDAIDDVRTSSWTFGKGHWTARMPAEGQAEIVVNNDDRRYSPEYSGSPLYGSMEQKRLMVIDVWHPGDAAWVRRFTGWTTDYQPSLGQIADHYVTIKAEQGMFRLREIKYRRPAADTVTADELIYAVILTGYVSPITPLQMLVGNSRLNAGYYVDPDAIMSLETGISSIPLSGEAWSQKDNAASVIEAAMVVEQGWFFIDSVGMIRFLNRHHYVDPNLMPPTTSFDLDFDVVSGEYVHAKEFKNTVRVTYYPTTVGAATIWTSREEIKLLPGGIKDIEVRFEYQEGKQMEVVSVNGFNGGVDDSSHTATNKAGVSQTDKVRCEFQQIDGRGGRLTVINGRGATRLVYVTLKGQVKESYGGQTFEANSEIPNQSGTYIMDVSTKLIAGEQGAGNLAQFLLAKHERAVGEFNSMSLTGTNDTELERILDTNIGDKIEASDYQSGHSGEYAIIGEDHSIQQDGIMRSKFVLDPLFRRVQPWIVGTSALGVDAYLGY